MIDKQKTAEEQAIDAGCRNLDRSLRAREAVQGEHLTVEALCKRCGITRSRFRYLKNMHLVSRALGTGRHAYYTERHEKEVKRVEGLAWELGGVTKVLEAARHVTLSSQAASAADGEFSYTNERVYTLATGIKIVVPETIGQTGSEQLTRILLAARDPSGKVHDEIFEGLLNRLDEGQLAAERPKTKVKKASPTPFPTP